MQDHRGFSLISVMLALLFSSLAAVMVVSLSPPAQMAERMVQTRERLIRLKGALNKYSIDHEGFYPVMLDLLMLDEGIPCELDNDPLSTTYLKLQGWCGPYLETFFSTDSDDFQTDGWGQLFDYDPVTGLAKSCGPDQSCGSGDDVEIQ